MEELKSTFGEYDPEGTAEHNLRNLRMSTDKPCTEYLTAFAELAAKTGWNDRALCSQMYDGLPARLKDLISREGKPRTTKEMRAMIQLFDQRHWERVEEKRAEKSVLPKSAQTSNSGSRSENSGHGSNHTSGSGNGNQSSRNNTQKSSSSGNRNSTPNPKPNSGNKGNSNSNNNKDRTPSKLDKDGKLTAEERQRRRDKGLCMFCGQSGHMARDCTHPGSTAAQAKARAATTASSATPQSSGSKA